MHILKTAAVAALVLVASQVRAGDLITKPSAHSVEETINRLVAAVENAGAKVVARIDHAAAASVTDMELRPTQMLMFGNPKLGTPAMIAAQTSGLDLPLRVLAYQDADGQVFVIYHSPADLARDHGIATDATVLKKMTGALDKLTNMATGE